MRHPHAFGDAEINAFLNHLATQGQVSTCAQNQALAALRSLDHSAPGKDVGNREGMILARRRKNLPVVLTVADVRTVHIAVQGAGISKQSSCHHFRHCFAMEAPWSQRRKTSMIDTNVLNQGPQGC